MKHILTLLLVFSFFFARSQGIEPSSFQYSPYLGGVFKAITPIVDEFTGDTLYQYVHVDSLVPSKDSIYLSNDTIFLRDGSGFVKIPRDSIETFEVSGLAIRIKMNGQDEKQIFTSVLFQDLAFTGNYIDVNNFNVKLSKGFSNDIVNIANKYGLIMSNDYFSSSGPDVEYGMGMAVDTSKVATPYDLTLIMADTIPSFTAGSVIFGNGTTIVQDNANLFFDDTNNRLGVGTNTPTQKLHVQGDVRVTGGIYDGSNVIGTSGQILQSTGSTTQWINPGSISGVGTQMLSKDSTGTVADKVIGITLSSSGGRIPFRITDNQKIDTFAIVANKLRVSNERDGDPFKEVDLSPYLDNTDAQNINILGTKGTITLSGSTPSKITLADSSATNEKITALTFTDGTNLLRVTENAINYDATLKGFQDSLISGTNIKTINSTSLLGSGNISVGTLGGSGTVNTLPFWATSTTLGDSKISQSGADLLVGNSGGSIQLKCATAGINGIDIMRGSNVHTSINSDVFSSTYNGTLFGHNIDRSFAHINTAVNGYWLDLGGRGVNTSDGIFFSKLSSGTSTYVDLLAIKASGNVGIGTASPTQKLHVSGTARITGSDGTVTNIMGRDGDGDVSNVGLGTGLSIGSGNLNIGTLNQNTTGSAATLTTPRTIGITGDLSYTSPSFNGSANVTGTGTLATVNSNVGSFTNASITVNGKGLITAASSGTAVTGESTTVTDGTYIDHTLTGFAISSTIIAQSIDSTRLGPRSVKSSELATDAVTTVKILDGNITTAKIAANAVTSTEINDNTIVAADLATIVGLTASTYNNVGVNTKGQVISGSNAAYVATDANVNKYLMKGTGTALDTVDIYHNRKSYFTIGGTTNNVYTSDYALNVMGQGDQTVSANRPQLNLFNGTNTYGFLLNNTQLEFVNNGAYRMRLSGTGVLTIPALNTVGTKMVTVNNLGELSSTTLPTGTVTDVSASAPIVSSGGSAPSISIVNANGTQTGALTSTDWTTFNNKDGSTTNEGSLTVSAGTSTTSIINSNTSGSTGVTITAAGSNSISESGNVITITGNDTNSGGTVTSIATGNGITGGTINSTGTLGLTGNALALHNFAANGIITQTGAGTYSGRSITGSTPISVANGSGVGGNPTIDVNTGGITSTHIANSTISTADIADDAVTSAKILDATITSADISSNAITTAKILDANVTSAKLATVITSGEYSHVTINAQGQTTSANESNPFLTAQGTVTTGVTSGSLYDITAATPVTGGTTGYLSVTAATDRITFAKAGSYEIRLEAAFAQTIVSDIWNIGFYKNGSLMSSGTRTIPAYASASNYWPAYYSFIGTFAATDYVTLVFNRGAGSGTLAYSTPYLSVKKL